MTTGDPEPQPERVRQLFLTGDLEQLNAQLSLEAALSADQTFRQVKRVTLTLYGPITLGPSTCWLIHDGPHPILSTYRRTRERTLVHFDPFHFSVSPDGDFQHVYDTIAVSDVDPCLALRVGLLRATSSSDGRLRLIFAVAGFENPPRFWSLVDDLLAELHGLGFHSIDPAKPPPEPDRGVALLPPRPEEPHPGARLDRWFDWRAECKSLCYQVTLREIATKARYAYDTVKKKHALYMAERRP